jgi:ribosomal protein S18 acetylase RimI-like enzyme
MEYHKLLITDVDRLQAFYTGLSPAVTETYRPFATISHEVMREHLSGAAAGSHISSALVEDGLIVGHSFIMNAQQANPVFGIGIADTCHGKGWGRMLMERVLAEAQELGIDHITLTVLKYNAIALSLYKSFGFRIVSDHTFKLKDDSYFMTRDGKPS